MKQELGKAEGALSKKSQILSTNLVRFADPPAENDGMMEYWNNGYGSLPHVEKYDDSWDK